MPSSEAVRRQAPGQVDSMTADELRQAILGVVNGDGYRPVKPRVIAKQLKLQSEHLPRLRRAIKSLSKTGQLAYGANHVVHPTVEADASPAGKASPAAGKVSGRAGTRAAPRSSSSKPRPSRKSTTTGTQRGGKKAAPARKQDGAKPKGITGTFRRHAKGYGFVRPLAGGPNSSVSGDERENDIYISRRDSGDAAQGDRVRVRLTGGRGQQGRQAGKIIDVLARRTHQFVGTYRETGDLGLVHVDGNVFSNPIYVGDPGAHGVTVEDKVVIEMVRFPSPTRDGEGVIVEVLGSRSAPQIDTLSIIYEFGLPGEFSDRVHDAARTQAERFDESIQGNRRDLTDSTVVTIDPRDARDFDDAISLERLDNGHWELGVHIADVSHFVRSNSVLDREARDRGTSVYLPDRVIPMLPEVISNNLASLQPGRVRYSMTAIIEMTPEGARVRTDVYRAAIKSNRRFTYEEVDDYLARPAGWKRKLKAPVHALLGRMHELAMILRQRRRDRGSLELDMPEVKIDLDKQGRVCGAHLVENTESHQIIEEFMLAANEAVAELLTDRGIPFLRRVHGSPSPRKLKMLTQFVRGLDLPTESLESRFALQKLLHTVRDDPRGDAINYATLRSMQRAEYSPENEPHYALAAEHYCHFTSPIRRYPDLTVHRLLARISQHKRPPPKAPQLASLGEHCSEREDRATRAERELTRLKLLNYLTGKIGMELEGVVTGVEKFGIFVRGQELPAEGLVPVGSLPDDTYEFDRAHHVLSGFRTANAFRLGDRVRVEVSVVDPDARELEFRLVGRPPRKTAKKRTGKTRATRRIAKKADRGKRKRRRRK